MSILVKLWNSPLATSWFNLISQSLSVVFVLPAVILHFEDSELIVFLLVNSFVALQGMFQLGFTSNLSRMYSYSLGGARLFDEREIEINQEGYDSIDANWTDIARIFSASKSIYVFLGFLSLITYISAGYFSLRGPVDSLNEYSAIWWILLYAALVTSTRVFCGLYVSYETGIGNVAFLARLESVCSLLNVALTGFLAFITKDLVLVILSSQTGSIIFIMVLALRKTKLAEKEISPAAKRKFDVAVIKRVIPSVWRSGTGQIVGILSWQSILVFAAQHLPTTMGASFLLTNKIFQTTNGFCITPLYSALPELGKYYGANSVVKLKNRLIRIANLSNILYVIAALILISFIEQLMYMLGKEQGVLTGISLYMLLISWFFRKEGTLNYQLSNLFDRVFWHYASIPFFLLAVIVWRFSEVYEETVSLVSLILIATFVYYLGSLVSFYITCRNKNLSVVKSLFLSSWAWCMILVTGVVIYEFFV